VVVGGGGGESTVVVVVVRASRKQNLKNASTTLACDNNVSSLWLVSVPRVTNGRQAKSQHMALCILFDSND
jgi:hypothetical protein